jgi:hypothetical protein
METLKAKSQNSVMPLKKSTATMKKVFWRLRSHPQTRMPSRIIFAIMGASKSFGSNFGKNTFKHANLGGANTRKKPATTDGISLLSNNP